MPTNTGGSNKPLRVVIPELPAGKIITERWPVGVTENINRLRKGEPLLKLVMEISTNEA